MAVIAEYNYYEDGPHKIACTVPYFFLNRNLLVLTIKLISSVI